MTLIHILDRGRPSILSHVLSMDSLKLNRDIHQEFFSRPHQCIVLSPPRGLGLPCAPTLRDILSSVDSLMNSDTNMSKALYSWSHEVFAQEDLKLNENFVSNFVQHNS